MKSNNYADTSAGYLKFIDLDSFVDFFLISEVTKNVDGYRLSTFLYKDRDSQNPHLKMGPVWDFNHSFGNADYYDEWKTDGWQLDYLTKDNSFLANDDFQVPFWWQVLKKDSLFAAKLVGRWNELKDNVFSKNHIYAMIDSIASHIDQAKNRNFTRWPVLGTYVWPNAFVGQTYAAEIFYMKNWISNRLNWINNNIENLPVDVNDERSSPQNFNLSQNYPNPFNPVSKIKYSVAERGFVKLKVFNLLGKEIVTLVNESKLPGNYEVDFTAGNLPSGVYFYRLESGQFSSTRKMILIK